MLWHTALFTVKMSKLRTFTLGLHWMCVFSGPAMLHVCSLQQHLPDAFAVRQSTSLLGDQQGPTVNKEIVTTN